MRGVVRVVLPLLATAAVLLLPAAAAFAHPLGNFTINTSAGIVVTPGAIAVEYVLDLAEIPTVQAMPELDGDGDGVVEDAEGEAWASARAAELLQGLTLAVDGAAVPLSISSATVSLSPGQGGLDILRLEAAYSGRTGSEGRIVFRDGNYEGRVGWHEVTALGADGVAIAASDVPTSSPSDRLRTYPQDLLSSPLDVREATVRFAPGSAGPVPSADPSETTSPRPGVAGGAFADLVERRGPLMFVALLAAFGFGALHAIGPGHGKTLMAAYLVGADGRVRQAVAVGGAVAVMHTASVLALGFAVLSATRVFAPERVYPWLGLASGLIALGLGGGLLVVRLGSWGGRAGAAARRVAAEPDHAEHEADHDHAEHEAHHGHRHPVPEGPVLSRRGLMALAVAGGILPSPTALVVLLASVALQRVVYGLALIGAFSVGLAAALVVVGVVALRARDVVARRMSGRVARLMPVASAIAIAAVGIALTVNGASQL